MNDDKLIGKNIKAIREYFGIKQESLAIELDISKSSLEKYEGGKQTTPDWVLDYISSRSGFPVKYIKTIDITDILQKNDGIYKKSEKFLDRINLMGTMFLEHIEDFFPIIESSKIKSEAFDKALSILNEIQSSDSLNDKLTLAINYFIESYKNDKTIESACNVISCIFIYYFYVKGTGVSYDNQEINSNWELITEVYKNNTKENKNDINDFINTYDEILNEYVSIIRDSEYYDYAYFIVVVRYIFNFFDVEYSRYEEQENQRIGFMLLDDLEKIGNKYAVAFIKVFPDEEDS